MEPLVRRQGSQVSMRVLRLKSIESVMPSNHTDGETEARGPVGTEASGHRGSLETPAPASVCRPGRACLRLLVALLIVGLCAGCVPGCLFMGGERAGHRLYSGGGGEEALFPRPSE